MLNKIFERLITEDISTQRLFEAVDRQAPIVERLVDLATKQTYTAFDLCTTSFRSIYPWLGFLFIPYWEHVSMHNSSLGFYVCQYHNILCCFDNLSTIYDSRLLSGVIIYKVLSSNPQVFQLEIMGMVLLINISIYRYKSKNNIKIIAIYQQISFQIIFWKIYQGRFWYSYCTSLSLCMWMYCMHVKFDNCCILLGS